LGTAEDGTVVKVETHHFDDFFDLWNRVAWSGERSLRAAFTPRIIAIGVAFNPFVQPRFRASERCTDGFWLLAAKKTLYRPYPLLSSVILHEYLQLILVLMSVTGWLFNCQRTKSTMWWHIFLSTMSWHSTSKKYAVGAKGSRDSMTQ
jgi:hypothetical protein